MEGGACNTNIDCKRALVCDGNLNECRKESSDLGQPDSFFCSQNGRLCQEMEGDCDNDNECAGSLKCGADNCESNYPGNYDCCYLPGDDFADTSRIDELESLMFRLTIDHEQSTDR